MTVRNFVEVPMESVTRVATIPNLVEFPVSSVASMAISSLREFSVASVTLVEVPVALATFVTRVVTIPEPEFPVIPLTSVATSL